jgi:hypothetical protein
MNVTTNIKKYFNKTMAIIAIGLTFMLLVNHTVNMHVHVLANGSMVTHAHPYDKTSDNELPKKHKHTSEELLFFSGLSLIFTGLLLIIGFKIEELKSYRFLYRNLTYSITIPYLNSGRSPPLGIFSYSRFLYGAK